MDRKIISMHFPEYFTGLAYVKNSCYAAFNISQKIKFLLYT